MSVPVSIQMPEKTDTALRVAAARRRITKSELLRKIVHDWLAVQGLPSDEQVKLILTAWSDGQETLDGAVRRIKLL